MAGARETGYVGAMYHDIGDHGIVGHGSSAALVARNGTIDWCCLPDFHSPATFAALLDDDDGGAFTVTLPDRTSDRQGYEPGTNVLRTTLASETGTIRIVDFMPKFMHRGEVVNRSAICRKVTCLDGTPEVDVTFDPRLDFGRGQTTVDVVEGGCVAQNGDHTMALSCEREIAFEPTDDGVDGVVSLSEDESTWLVAEYGTRQPDAVLADPETALERTRTYWQNWSNRCGYDGRWRKEVLRSALALKMLTFDPTGAVVAAATTSLPEIPQGPRNWDYRFGWIRDTILSAWALHRLDYLETGIDFLELLEWTLDPEHIPPIVDVTGDPVPDEAELDHLEGYRGSAPVRIGNGARDQLQWGSYGAMLDGAYFSHRKLGGVEKGGFEEFVKPAVAHVCENWTEPDHGIWEVRGGPRQFVTSKMWCWVAVDRGIRIAGANGYREEVRRWKPVRADIKEAVLEQGWDPDRGAFTMAFDENALDASVLLMPLVGFLPADDSKMAQTIEAIQTELAEGPLLLRYKPEEVESDPIEADDLAFTTCSFWLVPCLVRLGRLAEAERLFEKLLDYANHLGLYAEEVDPATVKHWGNFPQAYVHMALINAAVELEEARE